MTGYAYCSLGGTKEDIQNALDIIARAHGKIIAIKPDFSGAIVEATVSSIPEPMSHEEKVENSFIASALNQEMETRPNPWPEALKPLML